MKKIVIIGGSGLIGRQVAALLEQAGQQVVAASPSSGVDSVSGQGLAEALAGAEVVVDVTNSPSFAPDAVLAFFQASTRNLLKAGREAGVRHHVALSVVGCDRLPDSGYLRAKVAQEALIAGGPLPWTIVRATQFHEFLGAVAQAGTQGDTVRLPSARMQPVAAANVARALADVAAAAPLDGRCEVGGPQAWPIDELITRVLRARGDTRQVLRDDEARYFGARLDDASLLAGPGARIGATTLDTWLAAQAWSR